LPIPLPGINLIGAHIKLSLAECPLLAGSCRSMVERYSHQQVGFSGKLHLIATFSETRSVCFRPKADVPMTMNGENET
jgi:hypothetical protein